MGDHMAIYDVFGNQITQPYDVNGNELTNAYDIQGNLIWEKEASKDPYIAGRTLVWKDDFDGSSLDLTKWGYELGDVRANEIQTYRANNVSVYDSCLVLTAKKEDFGTKHWTSGSVTGQRKQSILYGRIEAKVKVPNVEGAFPAFWMVGAGNTYDYHETGGASHAEDATVYWPNCGEIDIFEYTSQNRTRAKGTLFTYTGGFVGGKQYLSDLVNSEEWNIYSCEWTEDYIKLYVNDVCFVTWNFADYNQSSIQAYFLPHYCLLDLAVGSYGGTPAESTTEMKMYIDWVRVYAPLES